MPEYAARQNYQVAKLEAGIKNMFGGKPDGSGNGKIIPPHLLYTPEEMLSHFAYFPISNTNTMPPETLVDLKANKAYIPMWVYELIDIKLL